MNVFIAGPRAITKLNSSIQERLHNIAINNITVLVGDANGIDKSIQQYFSDISYKNVIVFVSGNKSRNNIGAWQVNQVEVPKKVKGFDFYAEKDKAMAKDADYGFMIWNGESKGTLNNMINLVGQNKKVLVYFFPKGEFVSINSTAHLKKLLSFCSEETNVLYEQLMGKSVPQNIQISLYDNVSKNPVSNRL